jgi:hypothetical protein
VPRVFLTTALALTLLAAVAAAAPVPAGAATPVAPKKKAKKPKLRTKWLCGPRGPKDNPCHASQRTTVVKSNLSTSLQRWGLARNPRVDCFYVYPTVSPQPGPNAPLASSPEIRAAAQLQASRFSSRCRVYAPLYRQVTQPALLNPGLNTPAARNRAYADVLTAFREYMANDNDGRPFVLIGHDQGASLLTRLVREQIDPKAKVRAQMLSAMLPGGNVVVPRGRKLGGDFKHIPPCRSDTELACVIAYSSYDSQPPSDAYVSRLYSGAFPRRLDGTKQVLCTNPAALAGGIGTITPYFPTRTLPGPLSAMSPPLPTISTPWVTYPNLYTTRCKDDQGATWLQITQTHNTADPRPRVQAVQGPRWGFHLADMSLGFGQLVRLVGIQADAYFKQPSVRNKTTSK